jgi:N-acetylglucosamine-6-phosphate deacetylase
VTTTVIRNADWVIAWDEVAGRHVYRRNIDIAFTDGTIVFVGRNYPGVADRVIDGADRLILPGLIDIHSHPEHEPLYRGVRKEHGLRNMHMTGALRTLAGVLRTRRRGESSQCRVRLLRIAAERRHLAGRHLRSLGRLDRGVCEERDARLSRPGLCLGALASRQ